MKLSKSKKVCDLKPTVFPILLIRVRFSFALIDNSLKKGCEMKTKRNKNMKIYRSLIGAFCASLLAGSSFAGGLAKTEGKDKAYITGYVGYFDVLRQNYDATQFGAEFRAAAWQYGIRPMFGISSTEKGSVYGYGGVHWDIPIVDKQLYISPNFAVGLYRAGDGKDLGGALEFRSGLELAYQFPNDHRLGLTINHISNAHLYRRNPGVEALLLTYSLQIGMK